MHIPTKFVAFLAALLMPLQVLSAGVLSVGDSIAGLGIDAAARGFTPGEQADLVVIPPSQHYLVYPLTLDNQGNATLHVPGDGVGEAGTYHAFVGKDGKRLSPDVAFEVLPDAVDPQGSSVAADRDNITADGADAARVTVILQDKSGNPLAGRPVELVSGSAAATVKAEAKETDAAGAIRFTVTTTKAGTLTLRALDLLSDTLLPAVATLTAGAAGGIGGVSPYRAQALPAADAATSFAIVQSFEVAVQPNVLQAGDAATLRIRALDENGDTVEDYTGTVRVTSTDPQATLPGITSSSQIGEVRFKAKDLGVRSIPFSVSFRRTGKQTVRVEDAADPNHVITGETKVTVTTSDNPVLQGLTITSPKQNGAVNAATVILEGTTQPYTNIQVSGGKEKATGDSGDSGHFAIPVALDTNQGEYTLHITDDMGGDVSLHLVRDTDPPAIVSAAFSPASPREGASAVLVVQSEPGLPSVTVKIGTDTFDLLEDAQKPGTYQTLFTAPKAGTYQPSLLGKDPAGNETTMLLSLTVTPKALAKVTNVRAEGKNGAVALQWDPVTSEPVDHYRVYVGESAENYAYSLDTPDASQSAATVTGLTSGTAYVFAVTAIQGARESEKSDTASARALGLFLKVTPQDEGLFLEWSLPSDASLKSFLLEYGTAQDALTEKRTLPGGDLKAGEKRSVTLRDLLPGVTYYARLTPVDTTGDALQDLIATGNGAPTSPDGTHYAAPDQIPTFPPGTTITPPNGNTQVGLPPLAWEALIFLAIPLTLFLGYRKRSRQATRFLRMMEARYHAR